MAALCCNSLAHSSIPAPLHQPTHHLPFHAAGPERLPGPISDYNWRFIATPYPSHEHINIYAPERDTPGAVPAAHGMACRARRPAPAPHRGIACTRGYYCRPAGNRAVTLHAQRQPHRAPVPSHSPPPVFLPPPRGPLFLLRSLALLARPAESAFARKTGLIVGTYKNRWAGSDIFQLRPRLFADCTSHPDVCEHYDWPADVPSQAVVYRQYTSHHFCLQPPGDTWIRSAVYDCLVALGRPIVFDDMFEQRMAYADLIDYSELVIKQEMLLPAGYVITDYIKVGRVAASMPTGRMPACAGARGHACVPACARTAIRVQGGVGERERPRTLRGALHCPAGPGGYGHQWSAATCATCTRALTCAYNNERMAKEQLWQAVAALACAAVRCTSAFPFGNPPAFAHSATCHGLAPC